MYSKDLIKVQILDKAKVIRREYSCIFVRIDDTDRSANKDLK